MSDDPFSAPKTLLENASKVSSRNRLLGALLMLYGAFVLFPAGSLAFFWIMTTIDDPEAAPGALVNTAGLAFACCSFILFVATGTTTLFWGGRIFRGQNARGLRTASVASNSLTGLVWVVFWLFVR